MHSVEELHLWQVPQVRIPSRRGKVIHKAVQSGIELFCTFLGSKTNTREKAKQIMEMCGLTPCGVRPSAPITPPLICKEIVGGEVWVKVHAAVGDSCSLAMALPRGIGFRGFRGSVCRTRPGKTPTHGNLKHVCMHTKLEHVLFCS